jgi:hypothetical protein
VQQWVARLQGLLWLARQEVQPLVAFQQALLWVVRQQAQVKRASSAPHWPRMQNPTAEQLLFLVLPIGHF